MTECTPRQLSFGNIGRREVVASFDGGVLSSDGGTLLLGETEKRIGMFDRLAACFTDRRNPDLIEHSVRSMVAQRVLGLALGYEDINDHDVLRRDPLLAAIVGEPDILGTRRHGANAGCALAGKSTLNRLELSTGQPHRYKKIEVDEARLDALLLDLFVESFGRRPKTLILDVDSTDDPLHGQQEGRHFLRHYDNYCYLPRYVFCGEQLLCARLCTADVHAATGFTQELARIVGRLRTTWPKVQIVLRGDSGFCRDELLAWCESARVDYIIGLAKNVRLTGQIKPQAKRAAAKHARTGVAARFFKAFEYCTLDSWSATRWVVGKAEHLSGGPNPRFIVTTLLPPRLSAAQRTAQAQHLYEQVYCARGDMENRIKEQQQDMFADRTSCTPIKANQLRLYFASFGYCLMQAMRRLALTGTELAKAQCGTIRLKLLKIAARVTVSVRRLCISLPTACPNQTHFIAAYDRLMALPLRI